MNKEAYIYFMTTKHNTALYIGVTNNLLRRVAEHKAHINKGFTDTYNCEKLVYFEEFESPGRAIEREKQLKNWKREWKNALVDEFNPKWEDLSEKIGLTDEFIVSVKEHYKQERGDK